MEPANAASTPFRVVTFNLRNGRADDGPDSWSFRSAWVPAWVAGLGADIIGLQEAFHDQAEAVHAALRGFVRAGVGRDDGLQAGEYCPLYIRSVRFEALEEGTFWFSEAPGTPGSMAWGASHPRICTWVRLRDKATGGTMWVGNLHLDHASQEARLRSADQLAARVVDWSPEPAIIMGDFNVGEGDPVLARLLQPGLLTDTFRGIHPDAADACTYHGFRGGEAGDKIDYILATPGVRTHGAAIIRTTHQGRYPSDHYPLAATLTTQGESDGSTALEWAVVPGEPRRRASSPPPAALAGTMPLHPRSLVRADGEGECLP
jgi:endonuclease/exonuclease/phosphatase family metal-dependent hydrolase